MVRLNLSRSLLALTFVGMGIAPLAAAPNIANVSPRGLRIGQPTTLVITGSDLGAETRLLLPAKIAAQAIKVRPSPTAWKSRSRSTPPRSPA